MSAPLDPATTRLDRTGYELAVDEDFRGPDLDPDRWIPAYLPQWSTPERSAARYRLGPDGLELRIEADQPAWSPEWDGEMRVSNLQTGVRSGPVDSDVGQHRYRPDLRVRTAQEPRELWTEALGIVEVRVRGVEDPTCMVALWMIGTEDVPERSAEVCVVEQFGRDVHRTAGGTADGRVGVGLHPFHDPAVRDDFATVPVRDVLDWHWYAVERRADRTLFYVDDVLVHDVPQGITYPLQLMLDLYEFPVDGPRDPADYPRSALVGGVRSWRPVAGATAS